MRQLARAMGSRQLRHFACAPGERSAPSIRGRRALTPPHTSPRQKSGGIRPPPPRPPAVPPAAALARPRAPAADRNPAGPAGLEGRAPADAGLHEPLVVEGDAAILQPPGRR